MKSVDFVSLDAPQKSSYFLSSVSISRMFQRLIVWQASENICKTQEVDHHKVSKLDNLQGRVHATNSMVYPWRTGKDIMNLAT